MADNMSRMGSGAAGLLSESTPVLQHPLKDGGPGAITVLGQAEMCVGSQIPLELVYTLLQGVLGSVNIVGQK